MFSSVCEGGFSVGSGLFSTVSADAGISFGLSGAGTNRFRSRIFLRYNRKKVADIARKSNAPMIAPAVAPLLTPLEPLVPELPSFATHFVWLQVKQSLSSWNQENQRKLEI